MVTANTEEAKRFRKKIREYNSALSFTSLKYSPDNRSALLGAGVNCFQIHGELYHLQGPLEPEAGQVARFSQLFLYDPEYAAKVRHDSHPELENNILERLTVMMHEINPFVSIYKMARERLAEQVDHGQDSRIILNRRLELVLEVGAGRRRFNLPTGQEVVMIIPKEWAEPSLRDVVLATRPQSGTMGFSTIDASHASYMPLQYVLLFPHKELRWNWNLELQYPDGIRQRTRLAQRAYYRYRLHTRTFDTTHLFKCQ